MNDFKETKQVLWLVTILGLLAIGAISTTYNQESGDRLVLLGIVILIPTISAIKKLYQKY